MFQLDSLRFERYTELARAFSIYNWNISFTTSLFMYLLKIKKCRDIRNKHNM